MQTRALYAMWQVSGFSEKSENFCQTRTWRVFRKSWWIWAKLPLGGFEEKLAGFKKSLRVLRKVGGF
jgi:hypothetical protein